MNKLELMLQGRINKSLNQLTKVDGIVMTVKEYIEKQLREGNTIFTIQLTDKTRIKKIEESMNQIKKGSYIIARTKEEQETRGSNHNLPEVQKYWKLVEELNNKPKITKYWVGNEQEQSGYEIPKIVAEYYLSKELVK